MSFEDIRVNFYCSENFPPDVLRLSVISPKYTKFFFIFTIFSAIFNVIDVQSKTSPYWFIIIFGCVAIDSSFCLKEINETSLAYIFTNIDIWLIEQLYQSWQAFLANDLFFSTLFSDLSILVSMGTGFSCLGMGTGFVDLGLGTCFLGLMVGTTFLGLSGLLNRVFIFFYTYFHNHLYFSFLLYRAIRWLLRQALLYIGTKSSAISKTQ